jgi:hypothetical protein
MIRPGDEIFLVICKDRHVDLMVSAHTTLESANAAIETFKADYSKDYEWTERDYGRSAGWLRYVDGGEDGPKAYIERSKLRALEAPKKSLMSDDRLLTETADDAPGLWGRMSEGWPGIQGDEAYAMYVFANCAPSIPYGSYVLISERGRYGATESYLRVHAKHIDQLRADFSAAGRPSREESVRRRGTADRASRWW